MNMTPSTIWRGSSSHVLQYHTANETCAKDFHLKARSWNLQISSASYVWTCVSSPKLQKPQSQERDHTTPLSSDTFRRLLHVGSSAEQCHCKAHDKLKTVVITKNQLGPRALKRNQQWQMGAVLVPSSDNFKFEPYFKTLTAKRWLN